MTAYERQDLLEHGWRNNHDGVEHEWDDDRIAALTSIGRTIEQRLADIDQRLAGLETRMDKQQKLMDLLHERFAARPVLVTWLIFAGIPGFLILAGTLRDLLVR